MAARTVLPQTGRRSDDILAEMREMKKDDVDWRHGRAPLFVFRADDPTYEIGRAAFFEFFGENALGVRRAFPSVQRMETEVVEMALGLFHAPDDARGFMTSGGAESILQAIQTCRDFTRAQRKAPALRGNIVGSETLHPAFDKGAKLMDLEVRRAPVGPDLRMDLAAIEALIDDETIMLVGSAPNFPFGMIDPIGELGRIAERKRLWLHVDACVGGYIAPFARMIGRPIPDFDFAVPAVCSMSADLHKFGYAPKPASTVFYRSHELAQYHPFDVDVWPNGRFTTATITGTRPAGGVAGAWATFQHLGVDGYEKAAADLLGFVDAYIAGMEALGLELVGKPDLSIVAFASREFDVFRIAEAMQTRGWLPSLLQRPKAIHRMMSMLHATSLEIFLADARDAIAAVWRSPATGAKINATY